MSFALPRPFSPHWVQATLPDPQETQIMRRIQANQAWGWVVSRGNATFASHRHEFAKPKELCHLPSLTQ